VFQHDFFRGADEHERWEDVDFDGEVSGPWEAVSNQRSSGAPVALEHAEVRDPPRSHEQQAHDTAGEPHGTVVALAAESPKSAFQPCPQIDRPNRSVRRPRGRRAPRCILSRE